MKRTWADFEWPDWIPVEVRKQIEQFWSDDFGRGPDEWLRDMVVQKAPKLGLRCRLPKAIGDVWVEGRFVHAWNNIGRMIHDDGTYSVVVFSYGGFWDNKPILPDESTAYGNDCPG